MHSSPFRASRATRNSQNSHNPDRAAEIDAAAEAQELCDGWIAAVLSDLELSPTARMVGASLGLAADLDNWLTIPRGAIGGLRRLGLPQAIIVEACKALFRRGRLGIWRRCDGQCGFELCERPWLRGEAGRS